MIKRRIVRPPPYMPNHPHATLPRGARIHRSLHLLSWHPCGVLDAALAHEILDFIETAETNDEQPFNRFTNLAGVEAIRLTFAEVEEIAARRAGHYRGAPVKSAILALNPLAFGMARMYEQLMQRTPNRSPGFLPAKQRGGLAQSSHRDPRRSVMKGEARSPSFFLRVVRGAGWTIAWTVACGCAVWTFGALRYDFPALKAAAAWGFVVAVVAALVFIRGARRKLAAVFTSFVLVLGWWFTLKATNDADWQPDVAQLASAEINGDEITLHNVRNCDYRTETDYTPRWETRTVRFSQITGIDMAIDYWGSPWIAHPIVSFQFADAPAVCFSIETRKKVGQTYSAIAGLYRQFELIYTVADERDVIRLRTNFRGENIYLYHTTLSPAEARERMREYLRSLNVLRDQPRWYNAVTTNCTTSIRTQHSPQERAQRDWRMLLNGKMDEMLYQNHMVATAGLPFAELKQRALIDAAAKAANDSPDFSRLIREGRPGF